MTDADLGWTAGIIDGEGCIAAYGQKRRDHPGKAWSLQVTVGNTDTRMLYRLQELWGGNIKRMAKPRIPEKHRQAYHWDLRGKDACKFLKTIHQWLVVKREQADLALQFGVLLNSSGSTCKVGEDNLLRREELSTQLKLAKVVGLKRKQVDCG